MAVFALCFKLVLFPQQNLVCWLRYHSILLCALMTMMVFVNVKTTSSLSHRNRVGRKLYLRLDFRQRYSISDLCLFVLMPSLRPFIVFVMALFDHLSLHHVFLIII